MRAAGGGGGVRVVVNPADLRRASARLKDASRELHHVTGRLRSKHLPEMPPGIAARVASELAAIGSLLGSEPAPLLDAADELRVRALWAEIADQLAAGDYSLTDAQLSEFMALAASGALTKYSMGVQAQLAGSFVGSYFRDRYRDPERLIQLATILRANGADDRFASSFVESFGAEAMADVPRVIQAMEWPGAYQSAGGSYSDPGFDSDLAMRLFMDDYQLEHDPVELLGAFSLALATATTSGMLDRDTEQAIAYDEDSWAVAQLLHEGTFGATFLRDVFHSGVIAQIGREAVTMGGVDLIGYAPIGGTTDHPISTDQKALIMNALLRNPEAAAMALAAPVPEQFQIGAYLEGKTDAIEILYDVARWDDDGELFARVYTAGVDHANDAGLDYTASTLTQSLLDRTLHSDTHLAPLTHALAGDLAAHHMGNLHESAAAFVTGDPDGEGQAGRVYYDEDAGGWRLQVGTDELESLFRTLADEPEAYDRVLTAAADWQADAILDGTKVDADSERANLTWATQIGAFDAVLMNANDLERIEDFDASSERHRIFFSFLSNVAGQIPHPALNVAVGTGLSVVEGATAPDLQEVVDANHDGKALIRNTMHAAIVAGYHENGLIVRDGPPSSLVDNGSLISYRTLSPAQVADFALWMGNSDEIQDVAGEAFDRADTTFGIVDTDQQ